MHKTFDHILLLGRPAAGKSEFIDFMKKCHEEDRAANYHIGNFEELDDFAWLWEKFLEDDQWELAGCKRLFSKKLEDSNYVVVPEAFKIYDFMIQKFNTEVFDRYVKKPEFYADGTCIIEFARGREDGYKRSLNALSKDVLDRAAILYVNVSFEESWRRNIARFEEKLANSILCHMAPKELMEHFYKIDDWANITSGNGSGYLDLKNGRVPFVTMNNEPEIKDYNRIAPRYRTALDELWKLQSAK